MPSFFQVAACSTEIVGYQNQDGSRECEWGNSQKPLPCSWDTKDDCHVLETISIRRSPCLESHVTSLSLSPVIFKV